MRNRRSLFVIASIIVSAATLWFILRDVPVAEVLDAMRGADAGYMLLAVFVASPIGLFARGARWRVLLGNRLPLIPAVHMVNIMFLGNQLPLRAGEVARGALAARAGVPLVISATSIVVDRLLDTLVVALFIALSLSQLPDAPPEVSESAAALGVVAIAGFLTLLLLGRSPDFARRLMRRLLDALPQLRRLRLESALDYLLDGLQPLTDPRALIASLMWTALTWTMALAHYYLIHLALGIQPNTAAAYPLGIALTGLSIALPVSVAALGPFEAAVIFSGSLVGVGYLDSLSLGFLVHGLSVFGYMLWGGIGLLALGVSPAMAFSQQKDKD